MTEAEFVDAIGPDHPAVRSTLDRLGEAEAALSRARQLANPRVEFGREAPNDVDQETVTVAWTPPIDGRRATAVAAARAGLLSAEADRAGRLAQARLRAREAFVAWSSAFERRELARQVLVTSTELARKTRLKAEAGEEAGLAASRIELQRGALAAELATAEADYARAQAEARIWRASLGDRLPAPVKPVAPSAVEGDGPLLAALRHEVESARLQERLAGRFWTAPELQAGVQRQDQAGASTLGPVFGLSWSIPVFDRGQAARIEARRRREAAEARLQLAETRRSAAISGSRAAVERLTSAATEASEFARQAPAVVDAALASFEAGEATVTDVLDTVRSAHEARRREIEARAAAAAAARELEAALVGLEMGAER